MFKFVARLGPQSVGLDGLFPRHRRVYRRFQRARLDARGAGGRYLFENLFFQKSSYLYYFIVIYCFTQINDTLLYLHILSSLYVAGHTMNCSLLVFETFTDFDEIICVRLWIHRPLHDIISEIYNQTNLK